jgi:hypothetical protein
MVKQGPSGPTDAQPKQDRRALLSYALFRWESAAILALTLILVVLVPDPFRGALSAWRWWFWLILGLLAEIAIVLTTLQDPDVRAQLADERVRAQLDPTTIANVDNRQIAERALRHRAEIELMVQRTRRQAEREQLRPVLDDVTRWTKGIVQLAQRLDDHPDPNHVPAQAESLPQDSLHALETTYARLQLIAAQGLNERRIAQLRDEIAKQVRVLHETMENLP